ncbi:alcohol dehydrogenase [Aureobasidium sp. EXF-10728]|nr:alcohol dehydrogenase [Aureobasidium sp. EXF-10728]
MSLPTTARVFRRTNDGKDIELSTEELPKKLAPTQVLIQIHAVSLNFRDVAMLNDRYPAPAEHRGIPCSDAGATVIAVGSGVTDFATGDHVSPTFRWTTNDGAMKALGGDFDGVLRDYAIFESEALIKNPDYLSHEEASTIPCAGVTAWTSLAQDDWKKAGKIKTALMEGTGGVSIFALLICLAADITPIITSSSDKKLAGLQKLAPPGKEILTINYRNTPDWAEEALKLTNDGVDVLVNNVGATTMEQSFKALKRFGTISLVGFLGGSPERMPDVAMETLKKSAHLQGIAVGTKQDHQDLCNFLGENKVDLKPTIDKIFNFENSSQAFECLYSGAHVGKVVIKI